MQKEIAKLLRHVLLRDKAVSYLGVKVVGVCIMKNAKYEKNQVLGFVH
ncbi:hypothetical protein ACEW7V_00295 [Areca yellow leaf disease phytoplasma]